MGILKQFLPINKHDLLETHHGLNCCYENQLLEIDTDLNFYLTGTEDKYGSISVAIWLQ